MHKLQFALIGLLAATPLAAQDVSEFSFGGDNFRAGKTATQTEITSGDVFMAGETVTVTAPASGSAHMLGRSITIDGEIGVNVYAAGQEVTISEPVLGNVTIFGQDLTVQNSVGGNLRAGGQNVTVNGDLAGSALLAGETIIINSVVSGDLSLSGDTFNFGDRARVDGQVTINHSEAASVDIPASVVSSDRITRNVIAQDTSWKDHGEAMIKPSFWTKAKGFFGFAIAVGLAAIILAALFPKFMAGARSNALERPLRTGWVGFLAISATAGSLVLLAMTGIGLLLVPVSIFLTLLLWFLGYVIGAYILGVGLMKSIGRGLPDDFADRAVAAVVGALAISLLALIPFIGWWVVLAITWLGAGGVIARLFSPSFFTGSKSETV